MYSRLLRVMYHIEPIFAEEAESSKKPNTSPGSSEIILIIHYCQGCHRKTASAFGTSRASFSAIIKKVVMLSTAENKLNELANKLLKTH